MPNLLYHQHKKPLVQLLLRLPEKMLCCKMHQQRYFKKKKKFTEMNENLTELGGGCIYQSFVLVQFVLWLLKEAVAIVLHLPFGGSA